MSFDDIDIDALFSVGDGPPQLPVVTTSVEPQPSSVAPLVDHRQIGPPPIFHYTLNCSSFDGETGIRFPNRCCVDHDCHEKEHGIMVYPPRGNPATYGYTRDTELGIRARVCCGRYAYVHSLSREEWVRKMLELDGVTDIREVNRRLHEALSWHPTYEQRKFFDGGKKTDYQGGPKSKLKVEQTCLLCGKKTSNSESICDKCMP